MVTPSGTFNNMGITSMQIKKSTDLGFDKEVSLSLQEVPTTETRTTTIPASYGKSGATGANAGTASTGTGSVSSSGSSSSSGGSGGSSGGSGGSSSSKKESSGSILYNVASAAGLV